MSHQTIKNLVHNLTPWKPIDSRFVFFLKWILLALVFFGVNAVWMPWRQDFSIVVHDSNFIIESFLWLVLSITAAFGLYESSFPQNETKSFSIISIILLCVLVFFAFKNNLHSFSEQWHPEMSLWRGRCGFIISAVAILETPFLLLWAKRGAPKNAGITGVFASLTSAALGCFLMQIICDHHNSLHLLLWHFAPVGALCFVGFHITKKLLRW